MELEGFKTSGLITVLEGKLKELKALVSRLEVDNVNLLTRGNMLQTGLNVNRKRAADLAKSVSDLETQRMEVERALADSEARAADKDRALAAAQARVGEKDTTLAADEARFNEAVAALTEVTTKYAAEKEASERLAQEKAKEFEDFKTAMANIYNDKFDEGFQTCDAETKEVVDMVDPNFDWDKFEKILTAKEKEKEAEKAGPSGHAQTK